MELFSGTFLDTFEDDIVALLNTQAALMPIFLLTLEEAGVPLPIPGDIVIAYIGYQVSIGTISYATAFILLLFCVLLGSTILFFLSRKWGNLFVMKVGKFVHIDEHKIITVEKKFKQYGPWVIIIGRHIPGFRIPITVFAGMSGVSYRTFILSTFVSVVIWIAFYLSLGQRLGKKTLLLFHAHNYQLFFIVIPLITLIVLGWLIHKKRKKQIKNSQQ